MSVQKNLTIKFNVPKQLTIDSANLQPVGQGMSPILLGLTAHAVSTCMCLTGECAWYQ